MPDYYTTHEPFVTGSDELVFADEGEDIPANPTYGNGAWPPPERLSADEWARRGIWVRERYEGEFFGTYLDILSLRD